MSIQDILKDKEKIKIITKAAFDALDINKTGSLERKEIETLLMNISKDLNAKKPSKDEIDEIIKELDQDKDGKIRPDEFQIVVEQVLESMAQTIDPSTALGNKA